MNDLLAARDPAAREAAWERLAASCSGLLLKVARSLGGDHDQVMDRYAYVLDRLRADGFRRLLAFRPDGPAQFSTWLVVTARRLCLDEYRVRFGRAAAAPHRNGRDAFRRRLALNQSDLIDLAGIPDESRIEPDDAMDGSARRRTVSALLAALPPRDQLLLQLRFRDGLTASEIARVMRFRTTFHVYRRVQTVLGGLKQALAAHPLFQRDG